MGKILIAEDDLTSRAILQRSVEELGHAVFCCRTGRQAWEALQVNQDIQMLITDVQMPEMDGRELIRNLRASSELKHLPVLIISGAVGPKAIADLLAQGATLFLPKPLDVEEVKTYVSRYVAPVQD
jgi:CheY-like chemotaxis protein